MTETKKYEEMTREEQIEYHKEQAKALKQAGSFKQFYYAVRKGTVAIDKTDVSEMEKKQALHKLLVEQVSELDKHFEETKGTDKKTKE